MFPSPSYTPAAPVLGWGRPAPLSTSPARLLFQGTLLRPPPPFPVCCAGGPTVGGLSNPNFLIRAWAVRRALSHWPRPSALGQSPRDLISGVWATIPGPSAQKILWFPVSHCSWGASLLRSRVQSVRQCGNITAPLPTMATRLPTTICYMKQKLHPLHSCTQLSEAPGPPLEVTGSVCCVPSERGQRRGPWPQAWQWRSAQKDP